MNATLATPLPASAPVHPRPALVTSVTLEAALIGIESARLALKCTEDQVMAWIASGELEWAFDLRGREASRAYVRVLTQSVVKMQQPRTPRNAHRRDWKTWISGGPSFEDVLAAVLRHHRPWIRSSELVQAWSCCPRHIRNLSDLGFLDIARKTYLPNEARLISRQSVAEFMRQRRIQ